MRTTIYQKFISRNAELFTMVEIAEGGDNVSQEVIPSSVVEKMSEDEFDELVCELYNSDNEKASWEE